MKRILNLAALALVMTTILTSCSKDNQIIPSPGPGPDVQKVNLVQTANIDLNLVAAVSAVKGQEYELSVADSPVETFTFTSDGIKKWHLGKLTVGTHRVNLHLNGPDGSAKASFFRYDVSNGLTTHSVSPTPIIGNNFAFDLVVEK